MLAQEIDDPRNAQRIQMNRFNGLRTENQLTACARDPQPFGDVIVGLFPDRKSTRLNSSHDQISYAVFCLKKKKTLQYLSHVIRLEVTNEGGIIMSQFIYRYRGA